ncbi:MAG: CTP synthase [Desulfobacteraceae bacterium]|nr:MAG: CTP synthase [Desulfobacteraceae bacterium]
MQRLSILGDYDPSSETHAATDAAIANSLTSMGIDMEITWVMTPEINKDVLEVSDGFLVAPGSPYRDLGKVLSAIQFARENRVPALGTCGGFQHMILEYARNLLGFGSASHGEYTPEGSDLFISQLACSLRGRVMDLSIQPGSMAHKLYQESRVTERYYCSFGMNPDYINEVKTGPMQFTGSDSEGEIRILELPDHPFFLGTLFVPQASSTPEQPHPLVTGLLRAIEKS